MAHFSDDLHAEPCKRCGDILLRSQLIPASRVLGRTDNGNPRRGWYCSECARIERKLKGGPGVVRTGEARCRQCRRPTLKVYMTQANRQTWYCYGCRPPPDELPFEGPGIVLSGPLVPSE